VIDILPDLVPLYAVMPPLTQWDRDQLRESIQEHLDAHHTPFWPGGEPLVDEDGYLLDGLNRLTICDELQVVNPATRTLSGYSADEKYKIAFRANTARRQMTIEQRRVMVKEYLRRFPAATVREAAEQTGMSKSAVHRMSQEDTVSPGGQARQSHERQVKIAEDDWEQDEERSPLQHSDHRKELWFNFTFGYAMPPGQELIHKRWDRRLQAYVPYPREGGRDEWSTGRIILTAEQITNRTELVAGIQEIANTLFRRCINAEDPLPTLEMLK
jgi:hypothetical protein